MSYPIETITQTINARRIGQADTIISSLQADERAFSFPEECLFFVINTPKTDVAQYIWNLRARGVRNFVIETEVDEGQYPDSNFLVVPSVLKALQKLAITHRERYNIPVIGITGSNGKTVVKEWLHQLLSPERVIARSPRSENPAAGVPLAVCQMDDNTELGIFEAGVSVSGEMRVLQNIIRPIIGIFTNIGSTHQESFFSMQEKCVEKLTLFKDCDIVIYNGDNELICNSAIKSLSSAREIAWSRVDEDRPLYISGIEKHAFHTLVSYRYLGMDNVYRLPFVDDASVENSIHCLATCLYLMLPADEINERMSKLEAVSHRLEVKEGINNCLIIDDSYCSDLVSLDIALGLLRDYSRETGKTPVVITSDIPHAGKNTQGLYQSVSKMLNAHGVGKLFGIGNEIGAVTLRPDAEKRLFSSARDLLEADILSRLHDAVVLIKGARKFELEQLSEHLELKRYDLAMEINLTALIANLNHYRAAMKPGTRIVCMVKASAYGTGAAEVAQALQKNGVDCLGVATVDEGIELRKKGITIPIMVMNSEADAFKLMFRYGLEPEIYSFSMLEGFTKAADKEGVVNYPIHLKFDTGMHRLGFCPEDVPQLLRRLKSRNTLLPRSVFSHLSGSDSATFDDFSEAQIALFDKAATGLQAGFGHHILRHICNSAAIERFPAAQYDMVRLGIGLYGVNPVDDSLLNNVATLRAAILQIRDVAAGETVGYSRKERLTSDSRIATLRIGYGDGLNRRLGNRNAYCLINGQKAPYVGNICMDLCMVDVSAIDCKEGDYALIFGKELPPTHLASMLDTIFYEVLTGITQRVKRVYYED